jgi:hypothetical protein
MSTRFYAESILEWSRVSCIDTRALFGTSNRTGFQQALRRHLTATADRRLADDASRSAGLLRAVKPTTARWAHLELGNRWAASQLTRLRLGCSRLAADQHHRGFVESPDCPRCGAGTPETREHYLLACPAWDAQRQRLWRDLAALDIRGLHLPCDCKTLLGGHHTYSRTHLCGIAEAVGSFLARTGRLKHIKK